MRLVQTQSDERLALLACHGHDFAFEELVRRYRPQLERHLRRETGDPMVAEVVIQRGLIRAWAELLRGGVPVEVRPWLYAAVQSVADGSEVPPSRAGAPVAPAERAMAAARGAVTALVPSRALVRR